MPHRTDVDAFLAAYPPRVREVARAARRLLKQVLPRAAETLDETARIIGYGYGPGYAGLVCTLIPSRAGVKLGIVRGAELDDPRGLLEGSGKVHRHVALRSPADLKRPGIRPLLKAALAAWRRRQAETG